ncbi:MAG: sigma-70 family RNA polymerase sigma factor [Kiritimatiellae bacterium]|nr:sigma-70 family RNA polymerase sigma factor [Kiritimatiellia bacterium]
MNDEAEECLQRYRAGQTEAIGELAEKYRRPLFAYILSMTGHAHSEAEDIFQEVWYKALRNLHKYRSDKFLSWLFKITHNLIIDRARKRKPDVSLQEKRHDADGNSRTELLDTMEDPRQSAPGEQVDQAELGERIKAAVLRLPAEQRDVFSMRMDAGLSFKEIARIQKTSINTALARMQYAVAKLREALQDDYAIR